jgi:hypothetical protein
LCSDNAGPTKQSEYHNYYFESDQWIHDFFFFPFPRYVDFGNAGPEKAKNLAGKTVLRLIQIRLATPSLIKITPVSQENSPEASGSNAMITR